MEFERNTKSVREVTMIPMINVIFLLLVFFLVAGSIHKFDVLPVELPEAISGQVLDEGHVSIVLGRYDEVLANDELITMESIPAFLGQQLKHNKERVITIKADANLNAKNVIAVMDMIKAAGGTNLSLVTQTQP